MSKFVNTSYVSTIDNIIDAKKKIINNPYYKYNDAPPIKTTYFNINRKKTTLDEGSRLVYTDIGKDSPIRYNKIDNVIIYSQLTISTSLSREDYGLEGESIEGEAVILPNTIIPYVGDFFMISHVKEKALFKVNSVSPDTLEDGSNMYKIMYKLEYISDEYYEKLSHQVVENYTMLIDNVGTEFKPIIRNEVYDFILKIDKLLSTLKIYYKSLFYSSRVQTFIYRYIESRIYDPYMIEFLIRNKLLEGDGEYIYITHQTNLNKTFSIDYDRTFFKCIEDKDISNIRRYKTKATAIYIDDLMSIFNMRNEPYFQISYNLYLAQLQSITCFNDELIDNIIDNKLFIEGKRFYNIIVKYFNNVDLTEDDINCFAGIDYNDNEILFYSIPCIIFCLEQFIKEQISIK